MTDNREETLSNFRARFVATIGTAGSKEGISLIEAVNNFKKDWNEPLEKYVVALGFRTITELLNNFQDIVSVRHGRVYPVVTTTNEHVFSLIDRTKRKNKKQKPFYGGKVGVYKTHHQFSAFGGANRQFPTPISNNSPSKSKRRGNRATFESNVNQRYYSGKLPVNAQGNSFSTSDYSSAHSSAAFWDSNASKKIGFGESSTSRSAFSSTFSLKSSGYYGQPTPFSTSHVGGFGRGAASVGAQRGANKDKTSSSLLQSSAPINSGKSTFSTSYGGGFGRGAARVSKQRDAYANENGTSKPFSDFVLTSALLKSAPIDFSTIAAPATSSGAALTLAEARASELNAKLRLKRLGIEKKAEVAPPIQKLSLEMPKNEQSSSSGDVGKKSAISFIVQKDASTTANKTSWELFMKGLQSQRIQQEKTKTAVPAFAASAPNRLPNTLLQKTEAPPQTKSTFTAVPPSTSGDGSSNSSASALAAKKRAYKTAADSLKEEILTPTKSPPAKAKHNVFDQQFQRSGLFRSQMLQIAKTTSAPSNSSPSIEFVSKEVRELVAMVYQAGPSITLEDLKRTYYAKKNEYLTGVKLADILGLKCKNHSIALQSYQPPIFSCRYVSSDSVISLSKDCDKLLEKMKSDGELPLLPTTATAPVKEEISIPPIKAPSPKNLPTVKEEILEEILNMEKKNETVLAKVTEKVLSAAPAKMATPNPPSPLSKHSLRAGDLLVQPMIDELKNFTVGGKRDALKKFAWPVVNLGPSSSESCTRIDRITSDLSKLSIEEAESASEKSFTESDVLLTCAERAEARIARPTMQEIKRSLSRLENSHTPGDERFFNSAHMMTMMDKNMLHIMNRFKFSKNEAKRIVSEKFNGSMGYLD